MADQIYLSSLSKSNDIFRDVNSIEPGDVWSKTIEDNISTCDILVVILTPGALESPEVEKEVLLAKKIKKKIMPCFFRYVDKDQIKWNLSTFEGIEFADKYELVRNLQVKLVPKKKPSKEPVSSMQESFKDSELDTVRELKRTDNSQDVIQKSQVASSKKKIKTKRSESDEIPEIIHKNDPRYLRFISLSSLKMNKKVPWYQKLVTINKDDKKGWTFTKYCPKCKMERSIHTNKAMNQVAMPDQVGECGVCGTLLKYQIKINRELGNRPPSFNPVNWRPEDLRKLSKEERWWNQSMNNPRAKKVNW